MRFTVEKVQNGLILIVEHYDRLDYTDSNPVTMKYICKNYEEVLECLADFGMFMGLK